MKSRKLQANEQPASSKKASSIMAVSHAIGCPATGFFHALPMKQATTRQRLVQSIATAVQLTATVWKWHRVVVAHGDYYKRGSGQISFTSTRSRLDALSDLFRLKPFGVIVLPEPGTHPLERLSVRLRINEIHHINGRLGFGDVLTFKADFNSKPAHVAIASDTKAKAQLTREANSLRWIAQHGRGTVFHGLCPKVLSLKEDNAMTALLLSHIRGKSLKTTKISDCEFLRFLKIAAKPVIEQHHLGIVSMEGPDLDHIQKNLSMLPTLYPRYSRVLKSALNIINSWHERTALPAVVCHGDYHLDNIRFDDEDAISGIIDWDRFRPRGMALLDALHLLVSSTARRRGVGFEVVLPELWNNSCKSDTTSFYLNYLQSKTETSHDQLSMIGAVLWLNYLWLAHHEKSDHSEAWKTRMIENPADFFISFALDRKSQTNGNSKSNG